MELSPLSSRSVSSQESRVCSLSESKEEIRTTLEQVHSFSDLSLGFKNNRLGLSGSMS